MLHVEVTFSAFCLLDCSEFYLHGRLQESPVLVRPRGGAGRLLEESPSERSGFVTGLQKHVT